MKILFIFLWLSTFQIWWFFDFSWLQDQTTSLKSFSYLKQFNRFIYFSKNLPYSDNLLINNINKYICVNMFYNWNFQSLTEKCLLYRIIMEPKDTDIPYFFYSQQADNKKWYFISTWVLQENLDFIQNFRWLFLGKILFSWEIITEDVLSDLYCLPNESCEYKKKLFRYNKEKDISIPLWILSWEKIIVYPYSNFFSPLSEILKENTIEMNIPMNNINYSVVLYKDPRTWPMDNRLYSPILWISNISSK